MEKKRGLPQTNADSALKHVKLASLASDLRSLLSGRDSAASTSTAQRLSGNAQVTYHLSISASCKHWSYVRSTETTFRLR